MTAISDCASQIAAIIGSAPDDLVDYYAVGDFPKFPDSRIRCLPFAEAKEYTVQMRGIPVVERLGLWILDDANDSNPFGYVSAGPCAGMIMHFNHDSEPEIAFTSLTEFLAMLRVIGPQGIDISEFVRVDPIQCGELDVPIRELAGEGSDDATFLLTAYLPIAAGLQLQTMEALATHDDFFVREAFAASLARNTPLGGTAIAERLASDRHPQVAHQGKAAVAAYRGRGRV